MSPISDLRCMLWCPVCAAAHEIGHYRQRHGAELYLPFIVPAGFGFLGSFGGITRLKGFLPDRDALLKFGAAVGPAEEGGWGGHPALLCARPDRCTCLASQPAQGIQAQL